MTTQLRSISNPGELEGAWSLQYAQLAKRFSDRLPKRTGVLVEIGCGSGQLTIPLIRRLPRLRIIGVDKFAGPYSGNKRVLRSKLFRLSEGKRVKIVVSDYTMWLSSQPDEAFDAIISSEFLPEIDAKRMQSFFRECYRILRPPGVTLHSFLSAKARNTRQRRLLEADSDPKWTKTPPVEWFSPPEGQVADFLGLAGFGKISRVRLRSRLVIRSEASRELLKEWDVRRSYWLSHRRELENEGLEIPDWIIARGTKLGNDSAES